MRKDSDVNSVCVYKITDFNKSAVRLLTYTHLQPNAIEQMTLQTALCTVSNGQNGRHSCSYFAISRTSLLTSCWIRSSIGSLLNPHPLRAFKAQCRSSCHCSPFCQTRPAWTGDSHKKKLAAEQFYGEECKKKAQLRPRSGVLAAHDWSRSRSVGSWLLFFEKPTRVARM